MIELIVVLLAIVSSHSLGGELPEYPPWKLVRDGPLITRYAESVNPDNAWREHPRPQLTRGADSFMILNGLWEFDRFATNLDSPPFQRHLPERILVPFPVESALSGIRRVNPSGFYWYKQSFKLKETQLKNRVILRLEACD